MSASVSNTAMILAAGFAAPGAAANAGAATGFEALLGAMLGQAAPDDGVSVQGQAQGQALPQVPAPALAANPETADDPPGLSAADDDDDAAADAETGVTPLPLAPAPTPPIPAEPAVSAPSAAGPPTAQAPVLDRLAAVEPEPAALVPAEAADATAPAQVEPPASGQAAATRQAEPQAQHRAPSPAALPPLPADAAPEPAVPPAPQAAEAPTPVQAAALDPRAPAPAMTPPPAQAQAATASAAATAKSEPAEETAEPNDAAPPVLADARASGHRAKAATSAPSPSHQATPAARPESEAARTDAAAPREATGEFAEGEAQPAVSASGNLPSSAHAAQAGAAHAVRGSPETVAHLAAQIIRKLDGRATRFEVALDPIGLGHVDVRVEIGARGAVSAALSCDNPQAAAELRSRAHELHKALEQAGLDLSGGLSFDVASDQGRRDGRGLQQDDGAAFRGRAFQAALKANDAADAAPAVVAYSRRPASGVDVRI